MIIYIVDTNIFSRIFNNFSPEIFPDIWQPMEKMISNKRIISVDESYCELQNRYGSKDILGRWLLNNRSAFLKPSDVEGAIVAQIFENKKFCEGVKEKSLRAGTPEADALLVAKAKITKGVLVTAEEFKNNSEKIPNICIAQGVPYMGRDDFFRILKNVSSNKDELEKVSAHYDDTNVRLLTEAELSKWYNLDAYI